MTTNMAKNTAAAFFNFKCPIREIGRSNKDGLASYGKAFSTTLAARTDEDLLACVASIKKIARRLNGTYPLSDAALVTTAAENFVSDNENFKRLHPPEAYAIAGLLMINAAEAVKKSAGKPTKELSTASYVTLVESVMWHYRIVRTIEASLNGVTSIEKVIPDLLKTPISEAMAIGGKKALREKAIKAVNKKNANGNPLKQTVLDQYARGRKTPSRLAFGEWNSPMDASKKLYRELVMPTKKIKKANPDDDARWRTTYNWLLKFEEKNPL